MAQVTEEYFIELAIPRPVDGLFTYRVPNEWVDQLHPGSWVRVPFGRARTHAFVVDRPKKREELKPGALPEGITIKSIAEIGSAEPILSSDVLELARFASEYYQAPLGEVLGCAVSASILKPIKRERKPAAPDSEAKTSGNATETIESIALSEEQEKAKNGLLALLAQNRFTTALVEGVTGSGKTEVYAAIAREVLNRGRNVLILVPEISLTPQIQERFETRLGMPVVLWHSAVSGGSKRETAKALIEGKARVVLGARSAVFAPIQNLGLVVVDEEHDGSYKQEDRVRYHARDLAIVRAKQNQAMVVLGSATPSLETIEKVSEGKFHSFHLTQRVKMRSQPKIEMIDLKTCDIVEDTQTLIAKKTVETLEETLSAGEQALVFLNRRGWASYLLCTDCGEVAECPNCSISLTLHRPNPRLTCHMCGHSEAIPDLCPRCSSIELRAMGAGTETLEEELPKLVRGMKALRLDRDQITSHSRLEDTLTRFRSQEFNTLLGTQMLVKGHDFPNVTLVVVMLADGLFRWPDFRAQERAYQVLQQVCGRSGRGERPGRVLIQAFQTDNPVIQTLTGQKTLAAFRAEELEFRKALHYPPFGRLALIRTSASQSSEAKRRAEKLASELSVPADSTTTEILGPTEAMIAKIKSEYRWDLLVKTRSISALHRTIQHAKWVAQSNEWPLVVDVDPSGLG